VLEKLRSLAETKRYQRSRKNNSSSRRLLIGLFACLIVIAVAAMFAFYRG
jgi:Na+/proline symporter